MVWLLLLWLNLCDAFLLRIPYEYSFSDLARFTSFEFWLNGVCTQTRRLVQVIFVTRLDISCCSLFRSLVSNFVRICWKLLLLFSGPYSLHPFYLAQSFHKYTACNEDARLNLDLYCSIDGEPINLQFHLLLFDLSYFSGIINRKSMHANSEIFIYFNIVRDFPSYFTSVYT